METDKKKHAIVMFFGTIVAFCLTRNIWLAGAVAIAIGLAKELIDWASGGVYDILDMSANAIGIMCAILLLIGLLEWKGKDW